MQLIFHVISCNNACTRVNQETLEGRRGSRVRTTGKKQFDHYGKTLIRSMSQIRPESSVPS